MALINSKGASPMADAEDIVARLRARSSPTRAAVYVDTPGAWKLMQEAAAEITRLRAALAAQQQRYEALRRECAEVLEPFAKADRVLDPRSGRG
jgi:hypothetical protein